MDKKYPLQFFCRKTKKDLIEITEWFEAGKVKIGFRKYDNNEQKGSQVLIFISLFRRWIFFVAIFFPETSLLRLQKA